MIEMLSSLFVYGGEKPVERSSSSQGGLVVSASVRVSVRERGGGVV